MTKLRRPYLPVAALAFAFALSGCASADQFDPTEWVPTNWFGGGKKPLPGERHEVFPGGVPGVPQGVPPDLTMGHQQTPDANGAITSDALAERQPGVQGQPPQRQAAAEAPKEKPKHAASRPKRSRTAKKRTPKREQNAEGAPSTTAQSAPPPSAPPPAAQPSAAPWPSQPAAQNNSAWPTPAQ